MNTYDVVVIGGGVAGVAAALGAAAAGARVGLVRAGPGASALAAGGWTGVPPAGVAAALARAGLGLVPCEGAVPHPDGRLLSYDVAPETHAAAALVPGTAERVLVCGIEGLPGWRPAAIAALLSHSAGLPAGALEAGTVVLPETPAAGWSEVSLAAQLERDARPLGTAVAQVVRERGASRVLLPAVLGLESHATVRETVQSIAGVRVGEMLGRAPSLPGWRLDRALLRCLADTNINVVAGRAVSFRSQGELVSDVTVAGGGGSVTVVSDGGDVVIAADSFILATGKFTGGGLTAEDAYAEPLFGSDVAVERFGEAFRDPGAALALTDPVRTEPQPVLGIGVASKPYRNVLVAGAVRAGVETARLGLGEAAMDGWDAGEKGARRAWD